MKKKIILAFVLSLLTAITCRAQLTHTSQSVKIILPKGFYKLSNQQVDSVKSIKSPIAGLHKTYSPYLYKIGFLLLSLNDVVQNAPADYLSSTKKFMDDGYGFLKERNNNTYRSILKNTANNNQVLIVSYSINKVSFFRFYCQNITNKFTLIGKIECPEVDATKAETLGNELLNNIQFIK